MSVRLAPVWLHTRTGNYSYHPKKKKIVRGDPPPCGRRLASDNLFLIVHKKKKTARVASHSYNTLKEKNVRGDPPPCGFTPART